LNGAVADAPTEVKTCWPLLVVFAALLSGCGSSSGARQIDIGAARTYRLAQFTPQQFTAGKPQQLSFTVEQPSGAPLTRYRTGAGPHTGVHMIIVRSDLGTIVHKHPPIGPDGRLDETITLPTPGRYRVVVDVYPQLGGPLRNFQLFRWITAKGGRYVPKPLPPFSPDVTVDGYRFTLHRPPPLRAIKPAFLQLSVSRPDGSPATFTPWFGALAHAIFFRSGSLDYFHTHVCSAGMSGCTSVLGPTRVTGAATRPGRLRVGVLLPVAGTWRLFLQSKVDGHVLTAPFTLKVR
jgi:hypothetical protein